LKDLDRAFDTVLQFCKSGFTVVEVGIGDSEDAATEEFGDVGEGVDLIWETGIGQQWMIRVMRHGFVDTMREWITRGERYLRSHVVFQSESQYFIVFYAFLVCVRSSFVENLGGTVEVLDEDGNGLVV